MRDRWPEIAARQAQLVAVSPEPTGTAAALADELCLPFPLLSDVDGQAIDSFGARNRFAGARTSLPHAAVFVIDRERVVRFASIDRNYKKRTTTRTILNKLDELPRA